MALLGECDLNMDFIRATNNIRVVNSHRWLGVCVCVCERERERERDRQTETETDRQTDRQTDIQTEKEVLCLNV